MSFAKQQKKCYALPVLTFWSEIPKCVRKKSKRVGGSCTNTSLQLQTMSATALPEAVATRKLGDLCSCCGLLALRRFWAEADNSIEKQSSSGAGTCMWATSTGSGRAQPHPDCAVRIRLMSLHWGFPTYSVPVGACLAFPASGCLSRVSKACPLGSWRCSSSCCPPPAGSRGRCVPHSLSLVPIARWTSLLPPRL